MNGLGDLISSILIAAVLLLAAVALLGILGYLAVLWLRWKDREKKSLEFLLLQVSVPHENEVKIDAMEQILGSLTSLYSGPKFKFLKIFHIQSYLSLEIVATCEDIRFYVACHRKNKELVERLVHGVYNGAEVQEVEEHNIFSSGGAVAYAWLGLKKENHYPLKTYKEMATDPLAALAAAMGKVQEGEGVAIQFLIQPAGDKWKKQGRGFVSSTKKSESNPEEASFKVDARQLEAIENKLGKAGFDTAIRIVVCAKTREIAKAQLSDIKAVFSQFDSPWNSLKGRKIRIPYSFMTDYIYRYPPFSWKQGESVLSSDELASLYHFPNKTIEAPNIHWLKSKRAVMPVVAPTSGLYVGDNIYRGASRKFYMGEDDRQRHFYIVGQTGVGKSWLLADMALQDIKAGKGGCFIDPHDTFEAVLARIPPERAEDVIYFDPSQTDRPMGLNIMETETEDQKHFVASSIINLMYKLYDPYKTGIVGPRFEHAIRNAMLTVMTEPGSTFVEVVRCLTDPKYVQELLPKVDDPMVRRYWTDQIAQTADFHKSETLDYIVSKFGRFVTNKMMRNIIGQSKSAFDFRKVMDEGKILVINLAKGSIGEENSSFLGLLLIPKILMAAMSRQNVPEEQRRDFYLYVDEFQNFATQDFAQILSEARKFHLNLTVANQFISQMEDEVKNAVFGNVGTICTFRVGISDANFLIRQYQPTFSEHDLLNLEMANAYMKTIINGTPVDPFSVKIAAQERKVPGNPKVAEMVKKLSSLKYGQPRIVVEAEIARRARL